MFDRRRHSSVPWGPAVAGLLWLGLGLAALALLAGPAAALRMPLALGLLTLFVAAIVASYSLRYMRADRRPGRYFVTLVGLVGLVLAALFTGNVIVLGLAWCTSSQLLAALIGHAEGWDEANLAARRTRIALGLGDAALVGALGLLAWEAGSVRIAEVLAAAPGLPGPVVTPAALLLVLAGAARCALPPFSGWLLTSMTAPTPVSALMHAGLVNAGGFLLIRFAPVLEAAPAGRAAAVLIGLAGAVYGLGVMLVRPDVKRSLAGSTVSQMGFMIMSCGLGAYGAALWHLIAHGLFKAWLFLGTGAAIGLGSGRTGGGRTVAPLSARACLVIVAGTASIALALLAAGHGEADMVPLLLALATAVATLVAMLGSPAPARAKLPLVAALAGLGALHAGGVLLARAAVGPDAAPLLPDWALVGLALAFLLAWAWQQRRIAAGRGLPLRLYVQLINAGTPAAAVAKGDA